MKMLRKSELGEDKRNRSHNMMKNILSIFTIISLSMPSFYNIANAVIYTSSPNWPGTSVIDENFPDSYKPYLEALKAKHPNWIFKAVHNKLDWEESVKQESYEISTGISTISDNFSFNWKADIANPYRDGNFVTASKSAVKYVMDPRNFLNEYGIFQFEALDYNAQTSTTSTIEKIISGTTMSEYPTQYKKIGAMTTLEDGLTWSQTIINAAKNSGGQGISAVFLASRMKQETALEILNNGSINGSNSTYPGIYNFFNIGASPNADGTGSVTNGLAYASSKNWTTPAASINYGATYLWSDYIQYGQNTGYFQKFRVSNPYGNASNLYSHQYMTNISAPVSEGTTTYLAYKKSGLLESSFVFYIPVFENMPNENSDHPDTSANIYTDSDIVYIDDGVVNGIDSFNIRSTTNINNIIFKLMDLSEVADYNSRAKFVRLQSGVSIMLNGVSTKFDKIMLKDGTEGYVASSYVQKYISEAVEDITLDKTSATMKVGDTINLTATILPTNAYNKNVWWASNNDSVATFDSNGKITAVGVGTATIFVTSAENWDKRAACVITVLPTLATSISANPEYSVVVGNYLNIEPTVLPSTTTNKSYDVSVTNTSIATVENGKIKGLKTGTTTAELRTKDGSNKKFTFNVKVIGNVATINSNLSVSDAGVITKVKIGTTASGIKENVTSDYTKKIVNSNGIEIKDTDLVGTGMKLQILEASNILQENTIVIYGDVNGDGLINSSDLFKVQKHILGTPLEGCYFQAGNASKTDTIINSLDLFKIQKHILGTPIEQ